MPERRVDFVGKLIQYLCDQCKKCDVVYMGDSYRVAKGAAMHYYKCPGCGEQIHKPEIYPRPEVEWKE